MQLPSLLAPTQQTARLAPQNRALILTNIQPIEHLPLPTNLLLASLLFAALAIQSLFHQLSPIYPAVAFTPSQQHQPLFPAGLRPSCIISAQFAQHAFCVSASTHRGPHRTIYFSRRLHYSGESIIACAIWEVDTVVESIETLSFAVASKQPAGRKLCQRALRAEGDPLKPPGSESASAYRYSYLRPQLHLPAATVAPLLPDLTRPTRWAYPD